MATVLIVEDEHSQAEVLTALLKLNGFDVAIAVNGKDGLAQLPSVQPALIVTDYMMPVMTGGEMSKLVRSMAQFETLPIVMTSATAPEQVAEYSAYYDSFLRKPYRWDDLFAEILRLLSNRSP